MKYSYLIIFIFLLNSCSSKNQKKEDQKNNPCSPGYVLFVYIGEVNKPVKPLLIRTDSTDNTYFEFVGNTFDHFERNGFIINETIEKEYMMKPIVDDKTFICIKKYMQNNVTQKQYFDEENMNSSIKLILRDRCDSIAYVVDYSNTKYFANLIDSVTGHTSDTKLLEGLEYIKHHQERK